MNSAPETPSSHKRVFTFAKDVVRGAMVDMVSKALSAGLLSGGGILALLLWRGGTVPAWLAALAVVIVLTITLSLGIRLGNVKADLAAHQAELDQLEEAEVRSWWAAVRFEVYMEHIADVLNRLQRVLAGDLDGVSIGDYIERGMIQPARDVLQRHNPEERVRLSVLLPDEEGERWRMAWSAGHSLDGQRAYNERIVDTLSRGPWESGQPEYWSDATQDERFRANPHASHPLRSMLCEPVKSGDTVLGVLNVISSEEGSFDPAEQRYVAALSSVIGVAVAAYLSQDRSARTD